MTMSLNVGEWGIALNVNCNTDLSAGALTLNITRPNTTALNVTAELGTDALTIPGQGTFAANEYARYVFVDGDLTVPGVYTVRLTYLDSTKKLKSDFGSFTVEE